MMNRLKSVYQEIVVPVLIKEFSYKNIQQVPKIEKAVVNSVSGDRMAMMDLEMMTGQRPVKVTTGQVQMKSKGMNAIAAAKFREEKAGAGLSVTLRRDVMYSFLDRLVNAENYGVGMRDESVFPELGSEALGKQNKLTVCITTTARNDIEAQRLLALLGVPLSKGRGRDEEGGGSGLTVLLRKK